MVMDAMGTRNWTSFMPIVPTYDDEMGGTMTGNYCNLKA